MFLFLKKLTEGGLGVVILGSFLLLAIGELYWLWMAFQIGSFWMFVIGIFSATQIARQLGITIQNYEIAKTFAEIEAVIAGI